VLTATEEFYMAAAMAAMTVLVDGASNDEQVGDKRRLAPSRQDESLSKRAKIATDESKEGQGFVYVFQLSGSFDGGRYYVGHAFDVEKEFDDLLYDKVAKNTWTWHFPPEKILYKIKGDASLEKRVVLEMILHRSLDQVRGKTYFNCVSERELRVEGIDPKLLDAIQADATALEAEGLNCSRCGRLNSHRFPECDAKKDINGKLLLSTVEH